MMAGQRSQWARWLWLGMGVLVAASLCWRESRELQIAAFRVLFHLNGDRTVAKGQPPGCCIGIVPKVEFTREVRAEWASRIDKSPDDFLLGGGGCGATTKFPSAEVWAASPLLDWGAIAAAVSLDDRSVRPGAERAVMSSAPMERALAVVHCAQAADADNGALWVAEALVWFNAGHDDAGLAALQTAGIKPRWRSGDRTACRRAQLLLVERGLPYFDASYQAQVHLWGRLSQVTLGVLYHLDRLIADAVRASDDARVIELLSLWADLRRVPPAPREWFSGVRNLESAHKDMAPAMAHRLGRVLPDGDDRYVNRWQMELDVCAEFIRARMPAAQAELILNPYAQHWEEQAPEWRRQWERKFEADSLALLSGMGGTFVVLLMALSLAATVIELPFALLPREHIGVPRYARFWFQFALAVGAALAIIYSSLHAMSSDVGLRDLSAAPEYTPRDDTMLAILLAGLLATGRVMLIYQPWLARLGRASMLLCYLAAVAVTAVLRWRAIELLASLYA